MMRSRPFVWMTDGLCYSFGGEEMRRNCSDCPYSFNGSRDAMSDICDGCTSNPDTGWGGFTDHSVSDEEGHHPHFMSEEEHRRFMETLDDDDFF